MDEQTSALVSFPNKEILVARLGNEDEKRREELVARVKGGVSRLLGIEPAELDSFKLAVEKYSKPITNVNFQVDRIRGDDGVTADFSIRCQVRDDDLTMTVNMASDERLEQEVISTMIVVPVGRPREKRHLRMYLAQHRFGSDRSVSSFVDVHKTGDDEMVIKKKVLAGDQWLNREGLTGPGSEATLEGRVLKLSADDLLGFMAGKYREKLQKYGILRLKKTGGV